MGIFSTSSNESSALEEFYSRSISKFMAKKTGGDFTSLKNDVKSIAALGGSVSGGYSALEEYGNSLYSSAKEKLIRGIAKDVSSMLKVTSSYADTADIKDVVAKLQRIVPDPKKSKSIKNDSAMHRDLCMALATSINKQYDMSIIDKDADPSTICNKVSEIMYSLFTGLHSEFLTISGDISRILKNLQILQEYVDSANKKLIQDLERADASQSGEIESIRTLYNKLTEEIDRQHTILANLTSSVIGPVGESLITILEDNDDFAEMTADIKKMTGTAEFGNKLGYLLNGTSGIAAAAQIVDKALKQIGMSVSEYKSVRGLGELREKVYNSMVKQKPSASELHKLLVAADLLYKNDMAHDDIVSYLEGKKGGYAGGAIDEFSPSFADAADIETSATMDGPFKGRPQAGRKSIGKQIDEKKHLRQQLFVVLNSQIKHDYDKIKYSLANIGQKIGGEIDLSPELDVFIRQLNNFAESQPDRQNIHIALSGYRTDISSTFVKWQFMENLYAITESAAALVTGKAGSIFKDVKDSIDSLIKAVNNFNETFTGTLSDIQVKSLGIKGGNQVDHLGEKLLGGDCGCTGGCEQCDDSDHEGSYEGGSDLIYKTLGGVVQRLPESDFTHYKTMKRSIREIDYFYRIAGIKSNMQVTAKEYENNTENYENILGEEAGYLIDQIQKRYNDMINALESDVSPPGTTIDLNTLYIGNDKTSNDGGHLKKRLYTTLKDQKEANNGANKQIIEDYEGGYKFLLEYIRSSKIEMLEAAQALDMYLSKLTQSIQFKPDQIKEFVQVLEQIEIVAKWFTDKSGDNLVGVFEAFSGVPTGNFPNNPVVDFAALGTTNATSITNDLATNYSITNDHYYKTLTNKNPGKFWQPRMMTRNQAINFVKQIEKSIKSVRALENIIATFSRINTNVSSDVKTFMSSGLMFKAFMKYSVASVISVGYLTFGNDKRISDRFDEDIYKGIHARMAVGLRFNKDAIKWIYNNYLELCDPLTIAITDSKIKNNDICDHIFELSIKSMIAKVFTIVGTYTLFNKPAKDQSNSFSMSNNPLRQILGGSIGGKEYLNIIPEATELYIRLPMLVEWYRDVFDFNRDDNKNDLQKSNPIISMIPDMESIWGPICKVIFIDARNIMDGSYPSEYAHRIIDSISVIYKHYNTKKSGITTREILNEFVLEVNRRYGFIMREEITAYLDEKNAYIGIEESYPDENRVEYDLVDVDAGMGRRPAPSDKFRAFSKTKSVRKFSTNDLLKSAKRFRQAIEDKLQLIAKNVEADGDVKDSTFRTSANVSLSGIVEMTKKKIGNLKSPDEKYMVIHEQLHGIEKFGDIDQQKMILFHETVITPLTVLYFTYLILNDFNKFCISLDPGSDDNKIFADAKALRNENLKKFKGVNNIYKNDTVTEAIFPIGNYAANINALGARQTMFHSSVLETLLRKVMNVGCDMNGLTEVYFVGSNSENSYPVLNYDKLEETCTDLLNNAKAAFHQLRKFMPKYIIDKYESIGGTDDTENRISLFYIQEQLFDRLFANKYGNGLTDANIGLKNIYITMTKKYTVGVAADAVDIYTPFNNIFSKIGFWDIENNDNVINTAATRLNKFEFGDHVTDFPIAYVPIFKSGNSYANMSRDESKAMYASIRDGVGILDNEAKKARSTTISKLDSTNAVVRADEPGDNPNKHIFLGTPHLYDLPDNKMNKLHEHLGLIPKLNNILYKYCNIFIDKATKKIYKSLIEKFVTGHNAKDILNGKNINDNIHIVVAADNLRAKICKTEPQPHAVLFATIANGLKGLILSRTEVPVGTGFAFIEDNFANISEFQKELMRANLPAFEKELSLLAKRAEFMKRCLEETNVNVAATAVAAVDPPAVPELIEVEPAVPEVLVNNGGTMTQENKVRGAEVHEVRKLYLISIYDDIAMTAKSLVRCIMDTQKELNDAPMYFETYHESIIDYNNRNGHLPLMPVSHVTHLMNFSSLTAGNETVPAVGAVDEATYNLSIIPNKEVGLGSSEFKFTYGTRGLLHYKQEPSLKHAPGVEALLDSYNSKLGGAASFDKGKMDHITKGIINVSRWVIDFMYHNQVLDTHDWRAMQNLLLNNQTNERNAKRNLNDNLVQNLTCQTAKNGVPNYIVWGNTSNIIFLVENDNFKQSIAKFMTGLASPNNNKISGLDRNQFQIYNILDLNIVPINIHAMQREIPFVNLFNYAYTFDHMIKNFIGNDTKTKKLSSIGGELPVEPPIPGAEDVYTRGEYEYDRDNVDSGACDTMVRHMIYPLGLRRVDEYINNTYKIMTGDSGLKLNRPKYLSDQLWNKVLLNGLQQKPTTGLGAASAPAIITDYWDSFHTGYGSNTISISTSLSYIKDKAYVLPDQETQADVQNSAGFEGFRRYQSKLVRWTEWFVQLQRIVRLLMRSQLEWVQDPVAQGIDALSEDITEYRGKSKFEIADYQ
jgi:hypothetical protein